MKKTITPTQKAVKISLSLTANQIKFICDFMVGQYVAQQKLRTYPAETTKQLKAQVAILRKHLSKSDLKENRYMEKYLRKSFTDRQTNQQIVADFRGQIDEMLEAFQERTKTPIAWSEADKFLRALDTSAMAKKRDAKKEKKQ